MRRFLLAGFLVLALLLFLPLQGQALTTTFDFEGLTPTYGGTGDRGGDLTTLTLTQDGLTITIFRESNTPFDTVNNNVIEQSGKAGFDDVSLDPFFDLSGTAFIVEFSQPVLSVSVDMGDYSGFDEDSNPT